MAKGPDFIAQLEVVLGAFMGQIACQAVIKNQLSKLNRDKADLTADDCKTLTRNILSVVSVFATGEEAGRLRMEMDKLYTTYCS